MRTQPMTVEERLRAVIPYQGRSNTAFLCHEAADQIASLLDALKPFAYGWTIGAPDAHAAAVHAARLAIAKATPADKAEQVSG